MKRTLTTPMGTPVRRVAAGLQRLAHNLGSVLRMLGHADAASVALRLEALLPEGDRSAAEREWEVLRNALRRLAVD